jgi:hypothetical protein
MSTSLRDIIGALNVIAKEKGYLTFNDINNHLPINNITSDEIEQVMGKISALNIDVVDDTAHDDPLDCESACARGLRRIEMAAAALRHRRVRHACQLLKNALAELQPFAQRAR